jgi:hypothetical protein
MMPGAVVEPHPHALNEHRPGPLTRLWVRLRGTQLDRALAAGASPNKSEELGVRAGQLVDERERLITDFRGPIYTGGRNSRLPEALTATQSALS